ncbi:MAG: hypothetical protein AB7G93_19805 [Bdellovibrionales bacterium]
MKAALSLFCVLALSAGSSVVFAGPKGGKPGKGPMAAEPTPEARKKMAEVHEAMAACLKDTTKPMAECKKDMRSKCEGMGPENCPMHAMKPMGPHHDHGHGPAGKKDCGCKDEE